MLFHTVVSVSGGSVNAISYCCERELWISECYFILL